LQPASESYCFAKEEMLDGKEKFKIFEKPETDSDVVVIGNTVFPEQWEMET
jgi:hypothetical protein